MTSEAVVCSLVDIVITFAKFKGGVSAAGHKMTCAVYPCHHPRWTPPDLVCEGVRNDHRLGADFHPIVCTHMAVSTTRGKSRLGARRTFVQNVAQVARRVDHGRSRGGLRPAQRSPRNAQVGCTSMQRRTATVPHRPTRPSESQSKRSLHA